MKKRYFIILTVCIIFFMDSNQALFLKNALINKKNIASAQNIEEIQNRNEEININKNYKYPQFYRGIYLNISSANNFKKLSNFVAKSKESHINTLVLDVQSSNYKKCIVPAESVQYCIKNGIHPIARIVVFPAGLNDYPISEKIIKEKLEIAESACLNGFPEIQFDYIRFNDSNKLKYLTLSQKYQFIEGFLSRARSQLKKYKVKIAADIFGRIPLNSNDQIGQRMEGLDMVVDMICPMAYPSHYTWSRKLQNDPYYTVYITSTKANKRTKQAEIVTYIQAFKMKLGKIPFTEYIRDQIKAVHDSGVKGYFLWNARQEYDIPLKVTKDFYSTGISKREKIKLLKKDDES